MKIIAHRGNLNGPSGKENHPDYILDAINKNFEVEIDIWFYRDKLFLGHDEPQYQITDKFLNEISQKSWIHCKNFEAVNFLLSKNNLNIFWHQTDDFVITRSNHIWTYPEKTLGVNSIAVMPANLKETLLKNPYAICTDHCYDLIKIMQEIYGKIGNI